MFLIIIFILFGYSIGQFPDSEYCSIPCDTGQHTMCIYAPVSQSCLQVESLMSPQRRQKILSLQNSFRNAVAGGTHPTQKPMNAPGSNMRQLYWDMELEGIAERWALQCNFSSNDDCRNVARFKVGQVMSKSRLLAHSLDYYETLFNMLWFAEIENLSKKSLLKYKNNRNIKHVAQILNGNTMRVGCADVITRRARDLKTTRVTICNYGPAVISGEEVYKIGQPCSNCPAGTKCRGPYSKYPHLCSEYRQFDIAEMKPNFAKNPIDYGSEDAPVLPNIDGQTNGDQTSNNHHHRPRYNEEKTRLPYGQRKLNDEDIRYTGRKGVNAEDGSDQDYGNGYDEDYPTLFGGRQLVAGYRYGGRQNVDPTTDSTPITPPAAGSTESPDANGSTESPDANGSTESPDANGSTESPDANGSTESPDANGSTESPDSNGSAEPPDANGSTESPDPGDTSPGDRDMTTAPPPGKKTTKPSSSCIRIHPSFWYIATQLSTTILWPLTI